MTVAPPKLTPLAPVAACLAALALAAGVLPPGEAAGDPGEIISLRYDLYARGARVYEIAIDFQVSPKSYSAKAEAKTSGLIGLFVDDQLSMSARGAIDSGKARPASFNYQEKDRKGVETAQLDWAGSEIRVARNYELKQDRAAALAEVVSPKLSDPLSAILTSGITASNAPCTVTERVYNGKEVYDLVFSYVKEDRFGTDDAGVYRGPSHQCLVVYKPVAGLSEDKMKERTKNPPTYRVWFAPVASKALGRELLFPVAATGKVKEHDVVIFTRQATIAGQPFNGHSLASR